MHNNLVAKTNNFTKYRFALLSSLSYLVLHGFIIQPMVNITSVYVSSKHCYSTIRHSANNSQLNKTANPNLRIYTDDSVDLVTNVVVVAVFIKERDAKLRYRIKNGTSLMLLKCVTSLSFQMK